jgi:DNA-binding FrmR family transcriptional regulator
MPFFGRPQTGDNHAVYPKGWQRIGHQLLGLGIHIQDDRTGCLERRALWLRDPGDVGVDFGNRHEAIVDDNMALDLIPQGGIMSYVIADIKKRALHRSKIIQGQIRGLEKMIEGEEYCMDIIIQSLAIQKSLGSLNKLIVENHLMTHVSHMMRSDDPAQRDKAVAEMLKIFELTQNRQSK